MPFGLINTGTTFQRLVNEVLQGLQTFAKACVDDSLQDHWNHMGIVLQRCKKANLTVKVSKRKGGVGGWREMLFRKERGQWISSPDPLKVEAIQSCPTNQESVPILYWSGQLLPEVCKGV